MEEMVLIPNILNNIVTRLDPDTYSSLERTCVLVKDACSDSEVWEDLWADARRAYGDAVGPESLGSSRPVGSAANLCMRHFVGVGACVVSTVFKIYRDGTGCKEKRVALLRTSRKQTLRRIFASTRKPGCGLHLVDNDQSGARFDSSVADALRHRRVRRSCAIGFDRDGDSVCVNLYMMRPALHMQSTLLNYRSLLTVVRCRGQERSIPPEESFPTCP